MYNSFVKLKKGYNLMIVDVYIDLLFLINFSMDLLCFYITSIIMKQKLPALRSLLAAGAGGIYSVFALLGSLDGVSLVLCDVLICIFMILLIFGNNESGIFRYASLSILYLGISMLLGGIMSGIFTLLGKLGIKADRADGDSISVFLFASIALISAILSIRGVKMLSKKGKQRMCRVRIKLGKCEYSLLGFIDTGNLVLSPLGRSVIFIDKDIISDSIPKDADKKFLRGEYFDFGASAISVNTAAGSALCVTFKPDFIYISPQKENGEYANEYKSDCLISALDIQSKEYGAIVPESVIPDY